MADKPDELAGTEQPFVSHLVELRDRLIRAAIAVGVCFGVLSFCPGPGALYDLLAAPLVAHLPAGGTLIATNVISPFLVPLKITLMAAFLVALPVVLYQAWAFVAPGLYMHEKKLVLPLVVSSTLLFFLGVGFCYFFVFGQVFTFIQSFAPKSVSAMPDIEAYLSFVLTMFIAFGAAFEVPIVGRRAGAPGHGQHREAEGLPRLLHRPGVHHRRGPHAAGRGLAAGAGDPDVPALRGRHLGGGDLHQAHPGAGRGEARRSSGAGGRSGPRVERYCGDRPRACGRCADRHVDVERAVAALHADRRRLRAA